VPLLGPLAEGLGAIFIDRTVSAEGKTEMLVQRAKARGAGRTIAPLLVRTHPKMKVP
jgi:1-acyl-sn-glycerol-3-phosphate acyltransferase